MSRIVEVMRFILVLVLLLMWAVNIAPAGPSRFPHGISSQGVPILSSGGKLETTGTVYFVDSVTGNNTSSGKEVGKALATVEYALETLVTSGKGDIVAILPGHKETIDSTIVVNTSNTYIVGLGRTPRQHQFTFEIGENAAQITPINIDVENVIFDNLYIVLASTAESQLPIFDIDEDGCEIRNCLIDFAGQDKMEGVDIAAEYYDTKVLGCKFINIAAGESAIVVASSRTTVAYCEFEFSSGNGLAIECVGTLANIRIHDNVFGSDGTDLDHITWNATPGEGHMVYSNRAFNNNADASCFGATDTDLDTQFIGNWIGATNGSETAYDPSP